MALPGEWPRPETNGLLPARVLPASCLQAHSTAVPYSPRAQANRTKNFHRPPDDTPATGLVALWDSLRARGAGAGSGVLSGGRGSGKGALNASDEP